MIRIQSPDSSDSIIEQEIVAKGLTAPRVTLAGVEDSILSEHYFTAQQGVDGARYVIHNPNERTVLSLLTFCVLVLKNGYTVTGESACASPENFDAEIGKKLARAKALDKVWALLGFRLRDQLSAQQNLF